MSKENKAWIAAIIIVVGSIGIIWRTLVYLATDTYDQKLTVVSLDWRRVIPVEVYSIVHADTRANQMPADAFNVYRYSKDDDWYDGKEWHYDTEYWATYDLNRWVWNRDLATSGSPKDEIVWPDFTPDKPDGNNWYIGEQREGTRQQTLAVHMTTPDGKSLEYDAPDYTTWAKFSTGQNYTVKINRLESPFWDTLKVINS